MNIEPILTKNELTKIAKDLVSAATPDRRQGTGTDPRDWKQGGDSMTIQVATMAVATFVAWFQSYGYRVDSAKLGRDFKVTVRLHGERGTAQPRTDLAMPAYGKGARIGGFGVHPAADLFPMMGDEEFAELKADIRAHGLRNPIWITTHETRSKNGGSIDQLILDGRNRGKACAELGIKPHTQSYKGDDPIGFVDSLNLKRRHLNPSQLAMIAARITELGHAGVRAKGKFAPGTSVKAAAKKLSVSERTTKSARAVLEKASPEVVRAVERGTMAVSAAAALSKLPHAKQREIAAKVDKGDAKEARTGHVRALVRQEEKRDVVRKINTRPMPMPNGRYSVIACDPPWPYDNSDDHAGSRGHIKYPSMPIDAICKLAGDVDRLAEPDCILWLWVTNAFIFEARRVLDAWGFVGRSMATWNKPKVGLGSWMRGKTEHVILATRGNPPNTLNETTTIFEGLVREHSRKPDQFFERYIPHCPGAKVEMFAREPREGWASWGAERELFAQKGAA